MKKKLLSLALALALCLSLTVPAAAYSSGSLWIEEEDGGYYAVGEVSGDGWSYDSENNDPAVLKLSGAQNLDITITGSCIIELEAGTKSRLRPIFVEMENLDGSMPVITFRGTGELEIIGSGFQSGNWETGALCGIFTQEVKLEDGLVMTGGAKEGDSFPLTLGPDIREPGHSREWHPYMANGVPAKYIHIGPAASSSAPTRFTDVAADSPFVDAINWAVEKGITNGTTATTFSPGNTCTTAQILTFLYRAAGSPNKGENERAAMVAWAGGKGLDTSSLDAPCTRSAAVTYMWKAAGSPKPTKTAVFADVSAGADYAQAVSWAVEKGITNGTGGNTFSPGGTCTRGQIVTFLYRAGK